MFLDTGKCFILYKNLVFMAKYLDYDGLSYLWQKMDARMDEKISQNSSGVDGYETIILGLALSMGGGLNNCNRYLR